MRYKAEMCIVRLNDVISGEEDLSSFSGRMDLLFSYIDAVESSHLENLQVLGGLETLAVESSLHKDENTSIFVKKSRTPREDIAKKTPITREGCSTIHMMIITQMSNRYCKVMTF